MAAIQVEIQNGAAWVTLRRPPLNLFVPDLIAELQGVFVALAADRTMRAAVVSGSGRAFTAGMDLRVLRDLTPGSARELIVALHEAIAAVHEAPFPVAAMIHGPCLGAGLELALACDLRLASEDAILGLPEVRVGIPSVIEAALLPALVGPGRAAELLLTGESIAADRALEWGLLNDIAPAESLRRRTEERIATILSCSPGAIRSQKALLRGWRTTDLAGAIDLGVEAFAAAYETDEPRRAMTAFLERERS